MNMNVSVHFHGDESLKIQTHVFDDRNNLGAPRSSMTMTTEGGQTITLYFDNPSQLGRLQLHVSSLEREVIDLWNAQAGENAS